MSVLGLLLGNQTQDSPEVKSFSHSHTVMKWQGQDQKLRLSTTVLHCASCIRGRLSLNLKGVIYVQDMGSRRSRWGWAGDMHRLEARHLAAMCWGGTRLCPSPCPRSVRLELVKFGEPSLRKRAKYYRWQIRFRAPDKAPTMERLKLHWTSGKPVPVLFL